MDPSLTASGTNLLQIEVNQRATRPLYLRQTIPTCLHTKRNALGIARRGTAEHVLSTADIGGASN